MDQNKIKSTIEKIKESGAFFHKHLDKGDFVFNARDTTDEKSIIGGSWIEYWKKMAGVKLPVICPLCGSPLNERDADGCHVIFPKGIEAMTGSLNNKIDRQKYIIPGHHKCNCQFGQLIQIKYPIDAFLAFSKITNLIDR